MPEDTALEFPHPEERDKNSPSGRGGPDDSGEAEGGETGETGETEGEDADDIYYTSSSLPIPLSNPQSTSQPAPLPATTPPPAPSSSPPPPSPTITTPTTSASHPTSVETLFILKTFDDNDAILSFADITTSWRHTDPFPVIAHTTIYRENAAIASNLPTTTPSESFGSVTKMSEEAGPPTHSSSSQNSSSQSSGNSSADNQGPPPPKKAHPPIGAIVVVPIVIIVLTIVAFFLWRRKRRARMVAAARVQEMRMRDQEEALPEYTAPASGVRVAMPYIIEVGGTASGTGSIGPSNSANNDDPADNSSTPPVLLSNTIQSAYMTGLDTSDNMSTTSSSNNHTQSSSTGITTPGNRLSYDARSMNSSDEPPPPYRPASVPPISRETSLRHPTAMSNNNITQVLAPLSEATRSSYDGTDDYHVADGLRNPFSGGSSRATTSIAEENESVNDPFDDQDGVSVMTRSSRNSRHSDALVSPLEERHPALNARLETRCCVNRPESMVV